MLCSLPTLLPEMDLHHHHHHTPPPPRRRNTFPLFAHPLPSLPSPSSSTFASLPLSPPSSPIQAMSSFASPPSSASPLLAKPVRVIAHSRPSIHRSQSDTVQSRALASSASSASSIRSSSTLSYLPGSHSSRKPSRITTPRVALSDRNKATIVLAPHNPPQGPPPHLSPHSSSSRQHPALPSFSSILHSASLTSTSSVALSYPSSSSSVPSSTLPPFAASFPPRSPSDRMSVSLPLSHLALVAVMTANQAHAEHPNQAQHSLSSPHPHSHTHSSHHSLPPPPSPPPPQPLLQPQPHPSQHPQPLSMHRRHHHSHPYHHQYPHQQQRSLSPSASPQQPQQPQPPPQQQQHPLPHYPRSTSSHGYGPSEHHSHYYSQHHSHTQKSRPGHGSASPMQAQTSRAQTDAPPPPPFLPGGEAGLSPSPRQSPRLSQVEGRSAHHVRDPSPPPSPPPPARPITTTIPTSMPPPPARLPVRLGLDDPRLNNYLTPQRPMISPSSSSAPVSSSSPSSLSWAWRQGDQQPQYHQHQPWSSSPQQRHAQDPPVLRRASDATPPMTPSPDLHMHSRHDPHRNDYRDHDHDRNDYHNQDQDHDHHPYAYRRPSHMDDKNASARQSATWSSRRVSETDIPQESSSTLPPSGSVTWGANSAWTTSLARSPKHHHHSIPIRSPERHSTQELATTTSTSGTSLSGYMKMDYYDIYRRNPKLLRPEGGREDERRYGASALELGQSSSSSSREPVGDTHGQTLPWTAPHSHRSPPSDPSRTLARPRGKHSFAPAHDSTQAMIQDLEIHSGQRSPSWTQSHLSKSQEWAESHADVYKRPRSSTVAPSGSRTSLPPMSIGNLLSDQQESGSGSRPRARSGAWMSIESTSVPMMTVAKKRKAAGTEAGVSTLKDVAPKQKRTSVKKSKGPAADRGDQDQEEPVKKRKRTKKVHDPDHVSPSGNRHGGERTVLEPEELITLAPDVGPISMLDVPSPPRIVWKGQPLSVEGKPGRDQLHPHEAHIASTLRLSPAQYLICKQTLILASRQYRANPEGKQFRKSDAQKLCRIDVNKTSRLWEVFAKIGWLEGITEKDI